jgi:acyl-CoA thioesterase YciA
LQILGAGPGTSRGFRFAYRCDMNGSPDTSRRLALRIATLPRDTNHYGTIFGGVVLSYIDQAGFVEARRHGSHRWVTAALDRVEFKAPIHVGDVVNLYATPRKFGTKSITILVEVEAERFTTAETVPVTAATMVMVAIDAEGRPIPFRSPPTVGA